MVGHSATAYPQGRPVAANTSLRSMKEPEQAVENLPETTDRRPPRNDEGLA
jgi:hypothetical protein